jgi:hypothetical protein
MSVLRVAFTYGATYCLDILEAVFVSADSQASDMAHVIGDMREYVGHTHMRDVFVSQQLPPPKEHDPKAVMYF